MTSSSKSRGRLLPALLVAAVVLPLVFALGSARAAPTELFFSEYIEGTSNNKALEIYNGTGASVNLATGSYSVQMCFNGNPACALTIPLTGTVASGDVYVLAQSAAGPAILAQADQTNGAGWFNGDDVVVLLKGGAIVDVIGQLGVDPGTEWGTGLTSTADNTLRRKASIEAGDTNAVDAFDPSVEWDGFATDDFTGLGAHSTVVGDAAPSVAATTPSAGATGVATSADISVTFSEPVNVAGAWFSISCAVSGAHTATASGGPTTFMLNPDVDFAAGETCTTTILAAQVSDQDADDPPDSMAANFAWSFTTVGPVRRIHEIQGAAHRSPLEGEAASDVFGVVTALVSNGFFFEDPSADGDPATSEGLFVFTGSAPTASVGDAVLVDGFVTEFRPGGIASANLTTTELVSPVVEIVSSGSALPGPSVIGRGGRVPPGEIIDNDSTGDAETSGVFDPDEDGLDFYESFESMRVRVNDARAVGPTNAFGEIPIVGDGGDRASVQTNRGGLVIRPDDFNPERIHLDDRLMPVPAVDVGDRFKSPVIGILDYSFGNFKLDLSEPVEVVTDRLDREVAKPARSDELAVATFNVENLDPGDGPAQFAELADLIVNHLLSPDLVALEEIQDANGPVNDGTVAGGPTLDLLVAAISAAGGPAYEYRQIDPVNNEDGGQPGGNIRVGFIFRTDRGLEFVDRPGGTATAATGAVAGPGGVELTLSPGRVDPTNAAWLDSRKPLAGEFRWRGRTIIAIANHFASKGGDDPLFGRFQPQTRISEVQRHAQAQVLNDFVDSVLAVDARALVLPLGDFNDFEFSETMSILQGGVLENLVLTLRKPERYTYVFEGNSQVLDHILASKRLYRSLVSYDVVHVNSEVADQASDHEPQVARFTLD
ncbi:MAG TPA: Ig-like domain-containing protein [Gaiellaceae bacterium]|nr:Ig-like domain-containing protein [Gaiellaceae bacterium]